MRKIDSRIPSAAPRAEPRPAPAKPGAAAPRNVPVARPGDSRFDAPVRPSPLEVPASPLKAGGPVPGTYPDPAACDQIAAMTDGVQRNYAITQAYSDLSHAMAQMMGPENASWATFGVWASKQAGASIRGEDLPSFIDAGLKAVPELAQAEAKANKLLHHFGLPSLPPLPKILLDSSAAQKQMSDALAGGNRAVFGEIGREFSVFVQTFRGDTAYDPAKVQQYLSHFRPDQGLLRDAFATYAKAMFETDPTAKAQEMLLANAQIGAEEQSRLQPYIEQALNAPAPVIHDAVRGALHAVVGGLPGPISDLLDWEIDRSGVVDGLTRGATSAFRHAATAMMMKLTAPHETLHLGQDLPNPPGQSGPFPKALTSITNPELRDLMAKLDRSPDSLQGTHASDWSNYADRMNYIFNLFRSRAQDSSLFEEPFGKPGHYPVSDGAAVA